MTAETSFDLVVIGGGPGGYVAAIRAAQLGKKVAVVEREHLGGICSNWGCIPTKALLHAADVYRHMQHAGALGLHATGISVDFPQVIAGSRSVAAQMNKGVGHLLKKNRVTLFEGSARLLGKGQVGVESAGAGAVSLTAAHIIIATGARPRELPGLAFDGRQILNYRDALQVDALPKSLLIVGAGAIGVEFASFFATFGTAVTLIEARERILPVEDHDVSAFVMAAFEKQNITIKCAATIDKMTNKTGAVSVVLKQGDTTTTLEAERILVSAGIVGNTDHIGLEQTNVVVENGHIVTDSWGCTAEPGVYAIGDVAGAPWLAHKASHEAVACVAHMFDTQQPAQPHRRLIPGCTYSYPQVASVGLTEEQARAAGHNCRIGRFPFVGNGKARALGDTDGFVKTIFDEKTGELLGAHLVGAEVTELVHGLVLAMQLEATEAELIESVFPHPSLSEAVHESVLMAYDRALHI